jgi:hypothetical protein
VSEGRGEERVLIAMEMLHCEYYVTYYRYKLNVDCVFKLPSCVAQRLSLINSMQRREKSVINGLSGERGGVRDRSMGDRR